MVTVRTYARRACSLRSVLAALLVTAAFTDVRSARAIQVTPAPAPDALSTLVPGLPFERALDGGIAHRYQLRLDAGEYAHVIVDQGPADLSLTLVAPPEAVATTYDGRWFGPESAFVIAHAAGVYFVDVSSVLKAATPVPYRISLHERRGSMAADTMRLDATSAATAAKRLVTQGTAESMRDAQRQYERLLPTWRALGDRFGEAQTLNSLGFILNSLGENGEKTFETYEQALLVWRAAGSRVGESETMSNMAAVLSARGDKRAALALYEQALAARRDAGDARGEAIALNNMATMYGQLGEPDEAIEYYRRAQPLLELTGDRAVLAATWVNIASAYILMGELQAAIDGYNLALATVRTVSNPRLETTALITMGALHRSTGEPERAIPVLDNALVAANRSGDRRLEANVLTQLGVVHGELGQLEKAVDYEGRALTMWRAVKDPRGEATALWARGQLSALMRDRPQALAHYRAALPLLETAGDRRSQALVLTGLGALLTDVDQRTERLETLRRATQLAREAHDSNAEAEALLTLALAKRDDGTLPEAREHLEEALTIVESARSKVVSPDLRISYLASKQRFYDGYIDVLMRLHDREPLGGHAETALGIAERARARLLLDLLAEARADIREGIDPGLLAREHAVQLRLNAKSQREAALRSTGAASAEAVRLAGEIEEALSEYREVQAQIRTNSPRYAALTQPQPLEPAQIRQQLDRDTTLIEYWLGEERSVVWTVTRDETHAATLAPRSELEALARRAYERLNSRQAGGAAAERAATAALSDAVIAPVASRLRTARLLVVAHGALQYVPFAALTFPPDRGGAPMRLITRHEIVSLPSASTLAALRNNWDESREVVRTLAMIADPVFSPDDPRVRRPRTDNPAPAPGKPGDTRMSLQRSVEESGVAAGGGVVPRLPFSRYEADTVLRLVPRGAALRAVDFEASRATVTGSDLGRSRIVHFATHGLLNTVHPELSGIVLSLVDRRGDPQDGFLRLHDVYNLRLSADLVVLSACQSGLGRDSQGEGLLGLTRGFMYAGAPRVVVSLWNVDDEATAELMKRFYENMLRSTGLPAAAALHAAQRDLAQQPRWAAPYYWAGFVVQGEWR